MGRDKIAIIIILAIGFLIRFIGLTQFPPSLNWDEVSHGYNAYSILKTGRDEWGEFFPLTNFRAYGDYPLPVNLYLTISSIALLGFNEFAIRFPHVILGTLTILATYFLVRGFQLGRIVALIAAIFVALDPWTLFPSRAVFQSNAGLFFITSGMAFFAYRNKYSIFLPISVLFFGISAYSYHNTRIFIPLILFILFWLWRSEWKKWLVEKKNYFFTSLVILAVFFLPLIPILLSPEGKARSTWVFIVDQGAVNEINESRHRSTLSEPLKRLFYNKATYFLDKFSKNYIGYFTPDFLFFKGGTQYQFSVPGYGVLNPVNLLPFYVGLASLFFYSLQKKKEYLLLLLWFLVGIVPAAITQGGYHVIRAMTVLPIPQIVVGLGLVVLWKLWKKEVKAYPYIKRIVYIPLIIYVIIFLSSFEMYMRTYVGEYKINYSWSWQYGYKEAVQFIKEHYNEYNQIIMSKKYGEPHEFILFYWPWDPEKYRNDPNLIRFPQSNWFWVDRFDKFYFVNDWQVPREAGSAWRMESGGVVPTEGKTLLITSPGNYPPARLDSAERAGEAGPPGWRLLKTVNFLDGKPAFEILENI